MSIFIIMTSLHCLLLASGLLDDGRRLPVFRQPGTEMEKSNPVSIWSELLQDNGTVSEFIIIERRESTCGASEKDVPCDVIKVSSGFLNEYLTIDDPGLVILGLPLPDGARVVMISPGRIATGLTLISPENQNEITEICLEHYNEKGFRICPDSGRPDSSGGHEFIMVQQELSGGEILYLCDLPVDKLGCDQIGIYQSHLHRME